jgi:hypothetical protein
MNHAATSPVVIAGLDPAIPSVTVDTRDDRTGMDARVKPWHDDRVGGATCTS